MSAAIYQLKHPVTYKLIGRDGEQTETVAQLEIRRPTGKDLLLIDDHRAQPMRLVLEMIAALSGQMWTVIERLDAEDIGPLGDLALAHIDGGPKIGATA